MNPAGEYGDASSSPPSYEPPSLSLRLMHYSNISNSLLCVATAVRGMQEVFHGHVSETFVSIYLLIFAVLLLGSSAYQDGERLWFALFKQQSVCLVFL